MSRKEWLTGNIAVIPFPARAHERADEDRLYAPRNALLEVALVPKNGQDDKPAASSTSS